MGGSLTQLGVNEKKPGSHSFDTWKMVIMGHRSREGQHALEAGHYSTDTGNLKENPPCNAEDNLRAGLVVIEAWFGGY